MVANSPLLVYFLLNSKQSFCLLPVVPSSPLISFQVTNMIKMIDVLEQNLVQNFIHSLSAQTEHLDELIEGILKASDRDVTDAINDFLNINNASDLAQALDIQQERIEAIQSGLAMKKENIADTAKIVALCLALETNALDQVEIADSLEDYPI